MCVRRGSETVGPKSDKCLDDDQPNRTELFMPRRVGLCVWTLFTVVGRGDHVIASGSLAKTMTIIELSSARSVHVVYAYTYRIV